MVDVVTPSAVPRTQPTEQRCVVSWAGASEPIVLKVYGPDGEVTVQLTPVRALELVKEMIEPAVRSIKVNQWGEGWPG